MVCILAQDQLVVDNKTITCEMEDMKETLQSQAQSLAAYKVRAKLYTRKRFISVKMCIHRIVRREK